MYLALTDIARLVVLRAGKGRGGKFFFMSSVS